MGRLRFALALVLAAAASLGGSWVGAQVHHVVGGDRGWDQDSGLGAWSSRRVFSVGDKLWFTYSAAKESVAELRTRQEFESCDVTNPIRMYTDGINSLSLDEEGSRYFASSKAESCKNGLKLRVDVKPTRSPWEIQAVATSEGSAIALAEGPSSSSNVRLRFSWIGAGVLAVVSLMGF